MTRPTAAKRLTGNSIIQQAERTAPRRSFFAVSGRGGLYTMSGKKKDNMHRFDQK